MGYAKYVGRVGALALALGVGGAVANGAGIATAAPDTTSPGVESAAPGNDDPPKHPATPKPHSIADAFSEVRHAIEGLATRPGGGLHTVTGPRTQVADDGDDDQSTTPTTAAPRTVVVQHGSSLRPSASPRRTIALRVESTVERAVGDVKDALERAPRQPVAPAASSLPSPVIARQSATNMVVADSPDPQPQARTFVQPSPVRSTVAAVRPVPRLLSLFGFGSHPGGGDLPRENPLVAAILGFVRRLDRTFDNRTPTTDFKPQQVVQVDADRAVGYLDPVDPDSNRLTYTYTTAKNGTVTFDPTTPGEFTYAAPAGRDETAPWTDTVTITTSDAESGWHVHGLAGLFQPGGGHTTTQTVAITLKKVDDPTVGDDGTVTGHVPADNSTLSYASGGDLPNTVGTVELNDDGTWVFKPSAAARDAAANGGPQSVTFTIIAKDGEHETPISLSAKITPTSGPPTGAEPSGPPVVGTDGSSVQASTIDNKTYLTITDANGVRHTSQPLPGTPVGNPVSAAGNGYQATFDGDKTYLNIVLPNGSVKSTEVQGQTDGTILVGSNGEAYVKSVVAAPQTFSSRQGFARFAVTAMPVGSLADTGSDTHYITVLKPDGDTFEVELTGQESGALVLTDDGYAYQTTYRGESGAYETYVTVINPDTETWVTSDPISGEPRQQIVTTNGTVFQLAYAPPADVDGVPGTDELTDVTTVNQVAHDGTLTTGVLHGDSIISTPVYAPDGRLFMTSYSHLTQEGQSSLVTIDEDGSFQTADLPGGLLFREVKFDADGYAYVATYESGVDDSGTYYQRSYVTVIAPDGTIPDPSAAQALTGTPRSQGLFFGPDGTGYITTSDGSVVKVSTIGQDGSVHELASLTGTAQDSALVAADGTIYQPTYEFAPDFGSITFYMNVIEPDGTPHKILLRGEVPDSRVIMDADGVVYQPSYDVGTYINHVTVVHPDGTFQETVDIPGRVFVPLVVGPDGTVYQTSYIFSPSTTWVSAISPDGTVRTSEPLNGPAPSGVIFDADGKVYQPLVSGTVELDPSTWRVYPTPDTFSTQIVLPSGATPTAPLVIGADGTAFQRSYDQGTNQSYLTVVRSDGSAFTSDPLPGGSIDSPVATADGTLYQLTSDGLGHKEYLNVVDSLGHTTSIELPGQLINPVVVGPNNTVYQTSQESDGGAGINTYVTVAGPDGANTTTAISGSLQGPIMLDGNGNAYLTTSDGAQSYVTVVNASGELVGAPTPLPNEALGGLTLGSTGAAYQTTRSGNQTYVATIDPDGTVHPGVPLTGEPSSLPVAGPDGTAIQTTYDFGTKTTYVSAIGADGTVVYTEQFVGSTGSGPSVGPDGTVYQMFYRETATPGEYETYVVAIKPDGSTPEVHVTAPITGLAHIAGIRFRDDGVAYLITSTEPPGDTQTYVTTFDNEGNVLKSVELRGLPVDGTYVPAANGTVYMTTYKQVPSSADPQETYVNFVDAAGVVHETTVHRAAYFGDVGVDTHGTVYQLTIDNAANQTYVTTVESNGVVHQSTPIPGYPGGQALVVAPDGTVYVTTSVNDGAAGRTYVSAVDPDGNVHTADPFSGYPSRGVVVDSHGKVFQSTNTGAWVVQTPAGGTTV